MAAMATLSVAILALCGPGGGHAFIINSPRGSMPNTAAASADARTSRRELLMGSTKESIAAKLDRFVAQHTSVGQVMPCSTLTAAEAAALHAVLAPLSDASLVEGFDAEDGRHLAMPSKDAHQGWSSAPRVLRMQHVLRDALCAETLKLWAHHVPASAKSEAANLTLPSMPVYSEELAVSYNKSFSCINGHFVPADAASQTWAGWPTWPKQGHFKARGHGPFPFWNFGKAIDGIDDMSTPYNAMLMNVSLSRPGLYNPGNVNEVWYDMNTGFTKFYHARCDWALIDVALPAGPCIHSMVGNYTATAFVARWYIYTASAETKEATGEFCCDDSFDVSGTLGTMSSNFQDSLVYYGEVDFVGDFYTGRAKRFQQRLNGILNLDVWYETTLDGHPLRFAEVASDKTEQAMYHDGGRLTSDMLPLLYTDYDNSNWEVGPDSLKGALLSVPAICHSGPLCRAPGEFVSEKEYKSNSGTEFWPICSFDLKNAFRQLGGIKRLIVCDVTAGVLAHDATGNLNHLRPQSDTHEYVVLDIEPDIPELQSCERGVPCQFCEEPYIPDERVIGSIVIQASDCSKQATWEKALAPPDQKVWAPYYFPNDEPEWREPMEPEQPRPREQPRPHKQ